jgi:hypothetical protein
LIYSVGSEGNYEWEHALVDIVGTNHCEIHIFGSGGHRRVGDPRHKSMHFHDWAIKSSEDKVYNDIVARNSADAAELAMLSLPESLEKLGHQNRTIDIIKLDCEQCSW